MQLRCCRWNRPFGMMDDNKENGIRKTIRTKYGGSIAKINMGIVGAMPKECYGVSQSPGIAIKCVTSVTIILLVKRNVHRITFLPAVFERVYCSPYSFLLAATMQDSDVHSI